jgi:hypothetical protein
LILSVKLFGLDGLYPSNAMGRVNRQITYPEDHESPSL